MVVANSVTGSFIQEARMHRLLYRFVLCVESFGGTDEVAENKDATTQLLAESRRIEEKDSIFLSRSILLWYFPAHAFAGRLPN